MKNGLDEATHAAALADPAWGGIIRKLEEENGDLKYDADKADDKIRSLEVDLNNAEIRIKELETALDEIRDTVKRTL